MAVDTRAELLHGFETPRPEGDVRSSIESEFSSPNLDRLKKFLVDFDLAAKEPEEPVSLEEFEKAVGVFERNWTDFVSSDGKLDVEKIEEFSAHIAKQKYDRRSLYSPKLEITPETINSDINDVSALVRMHKFFKHFSEDQLDKFGSSRLMGHLNEELEISELACLQQISTLGYDCYSEDVLARTQIPGAGDQRSTDERTIYYALKKLALASPEPPLGDAYRKLSRGIVDRAHGKIYSSIDVRGESGVIGAAYTFNQNFRSKDWKELDVTAEQSRLIYDLVEEPLFEALFSGGHESWDGTYAARVFINLKDPRAIPRLVRHLRRYGAGHTTNFVAYTISDILKNPLSTKERDEVINSMDGVEKDVVLKWYLNPGSLFHNLDGYGQASAVKEAEQLFANEVLCELAQKIAESKDIEIEKGALTRFFVGNFWGTEIVEQVLLENTKEVADLVAEGSFANLRGTLPKLFHNLVNPDDGDYFYFPKAIATKRLGISEDALSRLEVLYQSRELATGIMDRNSVADGLLFLSARDDGKQILEGLLSLTTGARADSRRIRNAFNLMKSLDNFGGFEFPVKADLSEVVADLREQLVVKTQEQMELDEEDLPHLRDGMEKFAQSGLLEIVPNLLTQFKSAHRDVHKVVKEIGQHIIRGDFQQWRNGLETAQRQLSVLDEDKREYWLQGTDEVKIDVNLQNDKERLKAAVDAIKRIGEEAKAHVMDVYKIEFSLDRLGQLERIQKELVTGLKSDTISGDEKRELGIRKRSIDAEVRIVQGFLGIENLNPEAASMKNLPEIVSRMKSAMQTLDGLEQPISDLDQIEHVLTTEKDLATVSTIRAYDSDDPMVLLNIGVEPRETCQSWRHGSYNYCLPAYVVDVNKRVINVENERGEILARSVIKLTNIRTESGEMPAILMEPVYSNSEMGQIYQAIVKVALAKAKSIGAAVVMTNDVNVVTGADNSRSVPVLATEAQRQSMNPERLNIELFLPQSYNSSEYSDSLGGVQSWFERYMPTTALVVTPSSAL